MAGDNDHKHYIGVKTPATIDCDNELKFLVATSAVAIRGLVSEW